MNVLRDIFLKVLLMTFAPIGAAVPAEISQGQSIRVLAPFSMSGPMSATSEELLAGALALFESVNSKGGVRGHRLELVVADVPSIARSRDVLTKALRENKGAVAIFMPMHTVGVLELLNAENIPMFRQFAMR